MTQTGEVYTLLLSGVIQKMSGAYKCVAMNSSGTASCTAVVNITEKMESPTFVVKPVNKDIKEEGKAVFECKAKGKPRPQVTWLDLFFISFCSL